MHCINPKCPKRILIPQFPNELADKRGGKSTRFGKRTHHLAFLWLGLLPALESPEDSVWSGTWYDWGFNSLLSHCTWSEEPNSPVAERRRRTRRRTGQRKEWTRNLPQPLVNARQCPFSQRALSAASCISAVPASLISWEKPPEAFIKSSLLQKNKKWLFEQTPVRFF